MKKTLWSLVLLCAVHATGSYAQDAKPAREQILKAAAEVMQSARYCTFVTVDPDGQPQARVVDPFAPEADMTVWIGTKANTRKVTQLARNPRATLLCFDPPKYAYVSLLGKAVLVADADAKAKHWKPEWKDFYQDENRGPDYVLLRFKPARLEILSPAHGLNNNPGTWVPVFVEF